MTDPLLIETVERAFASMALSVAIPDKSGASSLSLWDDVAEMGLPWISLPESVGGSEGSIGDALEVLRIAGRHAIPLPLAECSLLGGWLIAAIGRELGDAPITCVPGHSEDTVEVVGGCLRGRAHRVPWAGASSQIAALVTDPSLGLLVAIVQADDVEFEVLKNVAAEPRETVIFADVPAEMVPAPAGVDQATLRLRGALSRAALMAGALERVSDITIEYTQERHQFGKAVGSFQAVQQHLVHAAQQAAITVMAYRAAAWAVEQGRYGFEVAAAKSLANQAATIASRAAHQAHGAIGMTEEYQLQRFTRRLWAWREEYGTEFEWNGWLGTQVQRAGADGLYPLIAAGSTLSLDVSHEDAGR